MPESMKLMSIWVVWGFLALGAVGWGLQVVVRATGSSEGLAAWVQAVGSVVAILASVWISRAAERRAEARERAREAKVMLLLEVMAARALDSIQLLLISLEVLQEAKTWKHAMGVVERETEALAGFDVMDAPTTEIAQALLDLKGALIKQRHFFLQLINAKSSDGPFRALRNRTEEAEVCARRLCDLVRR